MKVRASLRSLKNPGSVVVRRRGHTYVINGNPRWKGRQG